MIERLRSSWRFVLVGAVGIGASACEEHPTSEPLDEAAYAPVPLEVVDSAGLFWRAYARLPGASPEVRVDVHFQNLGDAPVAIADPACHLTIRLLDGEGARAWTARMARPAHCQEGSDALVVSPEEPGRTSATIPIRRLFADGLRPGAYSIETLIGASGVVVPAGTIHLPDPIEALAVSGRITGRDADGRTEVVFSIENRDSAPVVVETTECVARFRAYPVGRVDVPLWQVRPGVLGNQRCHRPQLMAHAVGPGEAGMISLRTFLPGEVMVSHASGVRLVELRAQLQLNHMWTDEIVVGRVRLAQGPGGSSRRWWNRRVRE